MSALNLIDAKVEKKHPFTIKFLYTPDTYTDKECVLMYIGTEFQCKHITKEISLEGYNKVLDFLKTNYGHGPFNIKEVRNKLKEFNHIDY